MIVASFLTKDLLIDWREGERYFSQNLVDADVSSDLASLFGGTNTRGAVRILTGSSVDPVVMPARKQQRWLAMGCEFPQRTRMRSSGARC